MPFKPPEEHGEVVGYVAVIVITYLAALARIFYQRSLGRVITLSSALAQIFMSTLACGLVLALAMRFQWQISGTIVACGVASWCGTATVMILERRFLKRLSHELGVDKDKSDN